MGCRLLHENDGPQTGGGGIACNPEGSGLGEAIWCYETEAGIEVDERVVADMLTNVNQHSNHDLGGVIIEVSNQLAQMQEIEVLHVSRVANNLANCLARHGRDLDQELVIYRNVPEFAIAAFNEDVTTI